MLSLLANLPKRQVELSIALDGERELHSMVSSSVPFMFYKDPALTIERIHPLGGPIGGGTLVAALVRGVAIGSRLVWGTARVSPVLFEAPEGARHA